MSSLPHPSGCPLQSVLCESLRNEVWFYTLGKQDPFFLHQVAVDTYAAQHATDESKPISAAFALAGLCLLIEHNYTGREVQLAHMRLAEQSKTWPLFIHPHTQSTLSVADVMHADSGTARDERILEWAKAEWRAWESEHEKVRALLQQYGEPR